ncbi:MAG TPA: RNB domain-containing ribonuclease [Candidatus Dormibacteraeota bacterium]|nr:RNB domain-containing ribonuclease [Candidatus Dormibacteraeota bacterium]
MPQHKEISANDVIAHLAQSKAPTSVREIAEALELRHPARRTLNKIVSQLKRRGEIEELRGGRYRLAGLKTHPSRSEHRPERNSATPEIHAATMTRASSSQPIPLRRDPNEITGRLVAHRDGYGFVVPDKPIPGIEGDLFIGRDALGDAMHGDRVVARIERRNTARGRAPGRESRPGSRTGMRAEGRILRIVNRAHPTVVGLFRYGHQSNIVLPYDSRVTHEVVIPPGDELPPALREKIGLSDIDLIGRVRRKPVRLAELDGAVVNVELTSFPRGGVSPSGRVIEILGRPGELGVDVEIMIRKHHLPHVFPEEVRQEARRAAQPVGEAALEGREDFRQLPIVTIDGETARDFDDAVFVERRPNGWHLQVHIADVAHYVAREEALDHEARLRGTSVYFPDRAVPMLPEELSNEICSLKPREDRLVMSALMDFDDSGRMTSSRFTPGVIRSAERMTYTSVFKVLEGDPGLNARYASLAPHFRNMRDFALVLNAWRVKRGSIDFDLPEPLIEFDQNLCMVSIVRSVRNIAHRLIEEFMLAANRAVASFLEHQGVVSLHRVHEKPDAKKVLEFEELARAFGYSLDIPNLAVEQIPVRHGSVPSPPRARRSERLGRGRERAMSVTLPATLELDIRPEHYQRLTQKLAGKPEERIVSYLMLRSLKQARYAADPLGHFALAFDEYTHFTSPIRRYPDLIVHRILKWVLARRDSSAGGSVASKEHVGGHARSANLRAGTQKDAGPYSRIALDEIADESSEAERRAEGAERELMDWKTAQFMEGHLGEEYTALIISVHKFGFFVELIEVFVEGLVPITALEQAAGTPCIYRDRDHAIVALSGAKGGPSRSRHQHPARVRGSRSGQAIWRLGDQVRVRADRIDPIRRRVEFGIVDVPA